MTHVGLIGLQRGESPMADSERLHFLIADLRDHYDVERQLTKALSRLPAVASWSAPRDAFETHLTETRREVSRLERAIEDLWERVRNHRDDAPPPASETTVRVSVPSSAATGPTSMPHRREDYDAAYEDTLVAWARAIADEEPTDNLNETASDRTESKPATDH